MGGGLLQLVAQGAQDTLLTGNPQMSFFRDSYKRHTNFAMQTIQQMLNGEPQQGMESTKIQIARIGDLVQEVYLEGTTLETFANDKDHMYIAERMISSVTLSIGGQQIDKHYQRWWRLFSELYNNRATKINYENMVNNGNTAIVRPKNKVILPMIFFFNRTPALALPLLCLQYSTVELAIKWGPEYNTFFDQTPGSTKCWANYIYLDDAERKLLTSGPQQYLIEQVQTKLLQTYATIGPHDTNLEFRHPVKEIIWCCPNTEVAEDTESAVWNMTLFQTLTAHTGPTANGSCPHDMAGGVVMVDRGWSEDTNGPLESASIKINGQDVAVPQGGKYYNSVQSYYHHTGSPCPGVYSYSFALHPERHQPSGTCNFSRVDNVSLKFNLISTSTDNNNIMVFATNYNLLNIGSGMGNLGFGN